MPLAQMPKTFLVTAKDRLTGAVVTHSVSNNEYIRSQEDAEVYFATMATPLGGDHPGHDVQPKNQAKFDTKLAQWSLDHPREWQQIVERNELYEEYPELMEKVKANIAKMEEEQAKRLAATPK